MYTPRFQKTFLSNLLRHIVLFIIINVPMEYKLYISSILYIILLCTY